MRFIFPLLFIPFWAENVAADWFGTFVKVHIKGILKCEGKPWADAEVLLKEEDSMQINIENFN